MQYKVLVFHFKALVHRGSTQMDGVSECGTFTEKQVFAEDAPKSPTQFGNASDGLKTATVLNKCLVRVRHRP